MNTITGAVVMEQVRRIAGRNWGHVYRTNHEYGCTNIATGHSESCIIGRALMELGVPEEDFRTKNLIRSGVGQTLRALGIPATAEQETWLIRVQDGQDRGQTWGNCIARADEVDVDDDEDDGDDYNDD